MFARIYSDIYIKLLYDIKFIHLSILKQNRYMFVYIFYKLQNCSHPDRNIRRNFSYRL